MRRGLYLLLRPCRRRILVWLMAAGLPAAAGATGFGSDFAVWYQSNSSRGLVTSCSAGLAWHEAHLLQSCLAMFEATGDEVWLDRFTFHADTMVAKLTDVPADASAWPGYRDGFAGWGTARYDPRGRYQEYLVHDAAIGLPLARFAELVFAEPVRLGRFVPAAGRYVTVVESELVAKWFRNWTAQRGSGEELEHFGGWRNLPHNQFLAFGELLLRAAELRRSPLHPGPDPRVPDGFLSAVPDTMARLLKAGLRLGPEHDAYVWDHWPVTRPDPRPEDLAHANSVISFVLAAERSAVWFTADDLLRFSHTLTDVAWNGSLERPRFSRFVDGTGPADTVLALFDWVRLVGTAAPVSAALRCRLESGSAAEMNAGMARTVALLAAAGDTAASEAGRSESGAVIAVRPSHFRSTAVVCFRLSRAASVRVTVHDRSGRLVRVIARGRRESGTWFTNWRGHDEQGRPVPAGTYFCRLSAPGVSAAVPLVLLP